MSLINNMLNDLEKRQSSEYTQEEEVLSALQASGGKGVKARLVRMGILLIVLVLVATAGIFLARYNAAKKVFSKGFNEATSSMMVEKLDSHQIQDSLPASHQEATLQTITIDGRDHDATVQLVLDQKVHYQIMVDKHHENIELTLANTKAKDDLDNTSGNGIVGGINVIPVHNNLQLVVHVPEKTEVKNLAFDQNAKTPSLVLKLHNDKVKEFQGSFSRSEVPLTSEEMAQKEYQQAMTLLDDNHVDDAISQLKQIVATYNDFFDARKTLVILLIQQEQLPLAKEYIDEGLHEQPDSIPLIELKARVDIKSGHLNQALNVLQAKTPALEQYPGYYQLMAAVLQQLNKSDMAVQIYGQLLAFDSGNSNWWLGLAYAFDSLHRSNAAIDAYRHAVETGGLQADVKAYAQNRMAQLGG